VSVRKPLTTFEQLINVDVVSGTAPVPLTFPISFGATSKCIPTSLTALFVATYQTAKSEPRTS
jgi:hypothetical protein